MITGQMDIRYRKSEPADHPAMKALLFGHGANEWNYLPEDGVEEEFALLIDGGALAFVAIRNSEITGFAISLIGNACPGYLERYCVLEKILFIADVVVHPDCAGQGVGSELLQLNLAEARTMDMKSVFIERHEENLASGGMMIKAGFELVDTFYDPQKRFSGSRNSSILKFDL